MNKETILGIDLGGTNVRGGWVKHSILSGIQAQRVDSTASSEKVLDDLFQFIDQFTNASVTAIGIGVPGLVIDGVVCDATNIPAWKEIPLQQLLREKYQIPVVINNDANCFALGEFYFGKGKCYESMVGLTIGTGLGSGIIINKKL